MATASSVTALALFTALALVSALACKGGSKDGDRGRDDQAEASGSRTSGDDDAARLTPLGQTPDWSALDPYQGAITRDEFVRLLDGVYTKDRGWAAFVDVADDHASVRISDTDPDRRYRIRFAPDAGAAKPAPRTWRSAPPAPTQERPLGGLVVAVDPGHIGGDWARDEQRWFRVGDSLPVAEGDLNLRVSRLLATRLRALGAEVTLVRASARPVADADPAADRELAERVLRARGELPGDLPRRERRARIDRESRLLAYRGREIRARARLVNDQIRPDVTICVHFDAESWDDPDHPLTDDNHLHLLINGSYTPGELAFEDIRFGLLGKLLGQVYETELALSRSVAEALAEATGLPPEDYPDEPRARQLSEDGYVWARNLLANRIYNGPVIYLEPYVMNNREVFARLQAGDYEGERNVAGAFRPSIYREYADAVARGVVDYYARLAAAGAP